MRIDILPVDLKTKLVDKILASLTPMSKSIDEAWTKEAMRRKADIEAGEVSLVNGEEVFVIKGTGYFLIKGTGYFLKIA